MSSGKFFKIDGMVSLPKLAFIIMQFLFVVYGVFNLEYVYQLEIPFYSGGWVLLFALLNFMLYMGHFIENTPTAKLSIDEKSSGILMINSGRFRKKQLTIKTDEPHFIEFGKTHFNVSWAMVLLAQLWLGYSFTDFGIRLLVGTAYEQGVMFVTFGLSMLLMVLVMWFYPDIELILSNGEDNFVFLLPSKSLRILKQKSFFIDLEKFLMDYKQGEAREDEKREANIKQLYFFACALIYIFLFAYVFKFYYYQFVDVITTVLALLTIRRYNNYGVITQRNIHPTETAVWFFWLNELAFKVWYLVGIGIVAPSHFNVFILVFVIIAYLLGLGAFWIRISDWWNTTTQKYRIYAVIGLGLSIGIPVLNILSALQIFPVFLTVLNIGPPL